MKPYIDIVDDIKATSMPKFNGLLQFSVNFIFFLDLIAYEFLVE